MISITADGDNPNAKASLYFTPEQARSFNFTIINGKGGKRKFKKIKKIKKI